MCALGDGIDYTAAVTAASRCRGIGCDPEGNPPEMTKADEPPRRSVSSDPRE